MAKRIRQTGWLAPEALEREAMQGCDQVAGKNPCFRDIREQQ
jgi:hypothetical protein